MCDLGSQFVFIKTALPWLDARRGCSDNYVDMVTITQSSENQIILGQTTGKIAWIGVRDGWEWSDSSDPDFSHWAPGQPDNFSSEYCAVSMQSGLWQDANFHLSVMEVSVCYR